MIHEAAFLMPGFDCLPVPIVLLDDNLMVIYHNPAAQRALARPFRPGHALGERMLEQALATTLYQALSGLSENDRLEKDLKFKNDDGPAVSGIVVASRLVAHLGEHRSSFLIVYTDITNRSAMENIMESSFDNFIQTTINLDDALKRIKMQRTVLSRFKQRITKELDVARTVQKSIIASHFPTSLAFESFGTNRPSEEIGGDYLDVIQLDSHHMGFIVADVSGHGVAPALVTTILRAWVHDLFPKHQHLGSFFSVLNKLVYDTFNTTGFYLTAFGMILNTTSGEMELCSAGHDAVIRVREMDCTDLGTKSGGRVIGALEDSSFTSQMVQLVPGDLIVCHTDGISEARTKDGAFYGRERMADFIRSKRTHTLKEIVTELLADVDSFSMGEKAHDDQTVLLIRWKTSLD